MRTHSLPVALLAASALLLVAGCDDNDDLPTVPPAAPTTLAVLELANDTSEVADPFPVNDGAFTFNDTSETTEPNAINR